MKLDKTNEPVTKVNDNSMPVRQAGDMKQDKIKTKPGPVQNFVVVFSTFYYHRG
jgi:hypothetical protein